MTRTRATISNVLSGSIDDEAVDPPDALAAADEPAEAPWRASAHSAVAPRTRPFRILVAEDETEMRRVVVETLREDSYEVVELTDGGRLLVDIAARLKAKEGSEDETDAVDLIVSDIRMPICTGLQILEALRKAQWRTPVILMTAFGDEETRRHAESLRAILFDKPFDLDDLRTAVRNLLPRDRGGGRSGYPLRDPRSSFR